jgi:hypothetical protein
VHVGKGIRDVGADRLGGLAIERTVGERGAQIGTGDVLEHEERAVVVVVGDRVEEGHDPGMRQARDQAHLRVLAMHVLCVRDIPPEQLDRDGATERLVRGAVDGGHAAGADLLVQAVAVGQEGAD